MKISARVPFNNKWALKWFAVVILCFTTKWAKAQTVNPYPLVNFNDTPAAIDPTVQKVYTSTVALEPVSTSPVFNPATFILAAEPYYSRIAGLLGYVAISNVRSTPGSSNLLVTYDVAYTYEQLIQTPGISNELILSTIGDYQLIRQNVGSAANLLTSFYVFEANADNFVFTGSSLCGQPGVTCNGVQVECSESLSGVSVTCTSPCKLGFCQNNGTCAQENENSLPTCTCLSKADAWFLGAQCETFFAVWMVVLIVVGAFFLIVAAIIIACCVYSAKRRKAEKKESVNEYFTNKAFEKDQDTKTTNVFAISGNGYSANKTASNNGTVVVTARRSCTPSDRYESRSRRRRSNSDSRRSRRTYDSRRRDRRRSNSTTSNSSVSSYEDNESFDDSTMNRTTARSSSASSRQQSRTSSGSSTPAKATTSATSREIEYSDIDFSETRVRDQGTSPIRWNPTSKTPEPAPGKKLGKIDIAQRKGWQPSLGPQMFDLDRHEDTDSTLPSSDRLHDQPCTWDTDI